MENVDYTIESNLIELLTNFDNIKFWLSHSAFPMKIKALQCIITLVIGFRINPALTVHFLNSLGSNQASQHFTGAPTPTQP